MLKKDITYEDFFTEESRTETFYFNLTQTELIRFESRFGGDVEAHMNRLMRERKTEEMLRIFEDLILSAYGERGDGENSNKFVKTKELSEGFQSTAAYDALFTEISTDMDALTAFFRGIIPGKMKGSFDEAEAIVTRRMNKLIDEGTEKDLAQTEASPPPPPATEPLKSPEPPTQ